MSSSKGREEEVPVDLEEALLKASVWGFINGSKVLWEHQIFTSGFRVFICEMGLVLSVACPRLQAVVRIQDIIM